MRIGVAGRAYSARLHAQLVCDEARAIDQQSLPGLSRNRAARALAREADQVARELAAVEVAVEEWDGYHPPQDRVEAQVKTFEGHLATIEERLRQLRELPVRPVIVANNRG